MKLLPHARLSRSTRPSRASTLGGYLRSLALSFTIHVLFVLTFSIRNSSVGLPPGHQPGAPRTVLAGARGSASRAPVFGSVVTEVTGRVESGIQEPAEFELTELSFDAGPSAYFADDRPRPAFRTDHAFAKLPLSSTLVRPAAIELEKFDDSVAARERQQVEEPVEPAPSTAVAVGEQPEEASAKPEASGSGSEAQPARIVLGLPPAYPKVALRMGWEGSVVCAIEVDATGQVVEVRVQESSGYEALDEAAIEAIRGWRFEAGSRAGRRARTTLSHTIRFQISD